MTAILEIETKYCDKVDDVRLNNLAATNKPLWARQMWGYLQPAMARIITPPNFQNYLFGDSTNSRIVEPTFDSATSITDTEHTESFTVSLGEKYKGYDLFNAQLQTIDDFKNIELYTANAICTYDKTAGTVTITATTTNPIAKGSIFSFDFYTDGTLTADLTREEMQLIGYAFQVEWQERFNETWLDIAPKIDDKTFSEQNRANKMKADTERFNQLEAKFNSAMRKYEQNKRINAMFGNKF